MRLGNGSGMKNAHVLSLEMIMDLQDVINGVEKP
jgi:hypothetical protein